jgi:dipeptidyl aminopeptidase/acylaminoacyl peptidase/predicted Ser/Thr protein kinase
MGLSVGDRLGPYEIVAAVGAGGMGAVYRARDTRLDRVVAIKVSAAEFGERFEREARAIAQFNHPHICQLYDVGPNYLVMEYIEGTPLAGPMPVARAVALAVEVLDAIEAAHRRGITHRDLKPANILVTPQGVKLLDFGLAKRASPVAGHDEQTMRAVTAAGQIVGTLQYMAPEQLQGKPTDARSDLFSFGCVLYEMLTGKRAFDGGDPASVIAAVLTREAPSVSDVAPALDRIVRRSLAKDPEQRFQTAGDLKAALLWAMEHLAAPPSPPPREWWKLGAAAAIGAIAAAAVTFVIAPPRSIPDDAPLARLEIQAPSDGRFLFGTNTGGIALSPDGRALAFVASVGGRNGLWVRRLDESNARLLPGTDGASSPFWAPDGRSVGFNAASTLLRVDLDGGSPTPICTVGSLRGALWMSDGQIVFGTNSSGLQRVPASGGTPEPVTELDPEREGYHAFPQALDGDRVAFFVRATSLDRSGMFVTSLSAPTERQFLVQTEANGLVAGRRGTAPSLLWVRGETLFAQAIDLAALRLEGEARPVGDVSVSAGTSQVNATAAGHTIVLSAMNVVGQLTWFDHRGLPGGVLGTPDAYNTFDLSPNGQRVVASIERGASTDLWVIDVGRGGVATRVTTIWRALFPIWSPDGAEVAFGGGAVSNVFRKPIDGGGDERRVTTSTRTQMPMDWSSDGKALLVYEVGPPATVRDLLTMIPSLGEAAEPKAYLRTKNNEWWARFRPTSPAQWVAYQSDESDRWEVYVDSFPNPGHRKRISPAGGQYPQWAPNGRELFYVAADSMLMSVSLTFSGDEVAPDTPRPLFRLPVVDTGRQPFDVTPDGQRFLVRAVPSEMGRTLTAIVNWPALLAR